MEYRIQRLEDNGEWRFIRNTTHGYPYTYNTLEAAERYGPQHAVLVPEKFRIVYGEWTGTVV